MKLTKTKLKQIIKEEFQSISERKLPPAQDPEITAQWEEIKPSLDELASMFKESPTGPHHTMSKDVGSFKNKIDAGMRFVSYGENSRMDPGARDYGGTDTPPEITEGRLYDLTKETSVDYPEAYKAYKDSIGKIRAQSINLSDTDSYYYLLLLKEWLNFNVID